MSNIVAVLIVRCAHTGVYADGRPNPGSVTLYDLDEVTIQKNRTRYVPIPVGSTVDIPMSTRTFVSWHTGDICKFTRQGLITSEIILQFRDKENCGGPAGTGQALRPAVLNVERVGNVLRFVIPNNVLPGTLDSIGFLAGEPVRVTGLTGDFSRLNDDYVISSVAPGFGLGGADALSYLVEVASEGPDIPAATLAGVNLCLYEGRVVTQFSSQGDVGGLGANVFAYIAGQTFPNAGGGGGGSLVIEDEGIVVDPAATTINFVGAGVTASSAGPGLVDVTIPGGGGTIETFTSAEPIVTGDLVALNTSGQIIRANSSIPLGKWEVVGISTQTVGAGVLTQVFTNTGTTTPVNFAAAPPAAQNGKLVFLSTTDGEASTIPPMVGGNAVFTVGTLQGADGVDVSPTIVLRPQLIALRS